MNAAGATLQRAFSRNVRTAPALPPGPATPPLVQTLRLALQPFQTLDACARRWGDWFTLRLLGGRVNVFCSHPDAVRDVHAGDPETFRGGEAAVDILQPLLGRNSLLVLDGERHLRERKLMSPPFHGERVHAYGRLMRDSTERAIAGWPLGRPFPIHHEMQTITLDVIVRAVFGIDEGPQLVELRRRLRHFLALADGPSAAFIVLRSLQFELAGLTPWGQYVRRAPRDRRSPLRRDGEATRARAPPAATDILSLLLGARDEDGAADDRPRAARRDVHAADGRTRDHGDVARVGLLPSPPPSRRRRASARASCTRCSATGRCEPEHVGRLEYLDAVLKETHAPDPGDRTDARASSPQPARIGGRELPAGVVVVPGDLPRPPPTGDVARARALPPRALPRRPPEPATPSSRSAAASVAASARRSPPTR